MTQTENKKNFTQFIKKILLLAGAEQSEGKIRLVKG
jgi:hypothetical protein